MDSIDDEAVEDWLTGGRRPHSRDTLDTARDRAAAGNEYITEEWHYWRVFQRNVPEYGGVSTAASSSE